MIERVPVLPTISVITPSFNQAVFLEACLQSVQGQAYPNVEHIVVDGGSTDGTLDILKKYDSRIRWFSEPDHGQAHAINKGLALASGEVLAYLNSDDAYLPGALKAVGAYFAGHPEAMWLSGYCRNVDAGGRRVRPLIRLYKNFWLRLRSYRALLVLNYIAQPATFWRRCALGADPRLDEGLHYTMDYDLWLRIGRRHRLHVLPRDLALFRLHGGSKSGSTAHRQFDEELQVACRYAGGLLAWAHRLHRDLAVAVYSRTI